VNNVAYVYRFRNPQRVIWYIYQGLPNYSQIQIFRHIIDEKRKNIYVTPDTFHTIRVKFFTLVNARLFRKTLIIK